jgi:hypothetical protein
MLIQILLICVSNFCKVDIQLNGCFQPNQNYRWRYYVMICNAEPIRSINLDKNLYIYIYGSKSKSQKQNFKDV